MIIPFARRNPVFWIGDTVYLACSDEPDRGMVTCVEFKPTGELYEVTWGRGGTTYHFDFELSRKHTPVYHGGNDE